MKHVLFDCMQGPVTVTSTKAPGQYQESLWAEYAGVRVRLDERCVLVAGQEADFPAIGRATWKWNSSDPREKVRRKSAAEVKKSPGKSPVSWTPARPPRAEPMGRWHGEDSFLQDDASEAEDPWRASGSPAGRGRSAEDAHTPAPAAATPAAATTAAARQPSAAASAPAAAGTFPPAPGTQDKDVEFNRGMWAHWQKNFRTNLALADSEIRTPNSTMMDTPAHVQLLVKAFPNADERLTEVAGHVHELQREIVRFRRVFGETKRQWNEVSRLPIHDL